MPFAFTEQGVAMLSSVLKSAAAIQTNIAIMRAFVAMRNYIMTTSTITAELSEIRAKLALLEDVYKRQVLGAHGFMQRTAGVW